MSAGEAVGTTVFEWARDALGVTINEMFGQTEMNYIVGNSHAQWPAKPGLDGPARIPGHRDRGDRRRRQRVPARRDRAKSRCIASRPRHARPGVLPRLLRRTPTARARKFTRRLVPHRRHRAASDADGYLWYQGRADDMFKAAGYRIGPSRDRELPRQASGGRQRRGRAEARRRARQRRQGVHRAGARARAPPRRSRPTSQQHVRGKLAPYEYPKEIEFIDALPMTTTGKVQRACCANAKRRASAHCNERAADG